MNLQVTALPRAGKVVREVKIPGIRRFIARPDSIISNKENNPKKDLEAFITVARSGIFIEPNL